MKINNQLHNLLGFILITHRLKNFNDIDKEYILEKHQRYIGKEYPYETILLFLNDNLDIKNAFNTIKSYNKFFGKDSFFLINSQLEKGLHTLVVRWIVEYMDDKYNSRTIKIYNLYVDNRK